MTFKSEARVPTPNATRYATQVGKHWQHNMTVTIEDGIVTIVFPRDARGAEWPGDAIVTLSNQAECLVCTIDATAPEQRDGLKSAIERHVDRFAFREGTLSYNWMDA